MSSAGVAQLVEQLTCNQQVTSSNLVASSMLNCFGLEKKVGKGQVAEWSIAPDCKSGDFGLRWFKSIPAHERVAGATPFPLRAGLVAGSKSRNENAGVTQLVESQPSKLLVAGSSPVSRSSHSESRFRGMENP